MGTLRTYYWLAKPGIIYGNLLALAAGFFIGSTDGIDFPGLIGAALAVGLVIGSACVVNNYLDRDIDKVMARTKWRAFAKGSVPPAAGFAYAAVLGLAGFGALAVLTNGLTVLVGAIGYVDYVVLYGWSKRRTWHGTLIGSVSGSMPLVAGYTAVTGRFDSGALLLFLLMGFWQMPHFYAIAMRRIKDYKAAGVPVLPAVKGMTATKAQIIAYIAAFMIADVLLYANGNLGRFSALAVGLYGAVWLSSAVRGLSDVKSRPWAKKMFLYSLVFLPLLAAVTLAENV
jgi:protoheme IX farnesyltransferase